MSKCNGHEVSISYLVAWLAIIGLALWLLTGCAAGSNPDVNFSHFASDLHQMNTGYEARQILLLESMKTQPPIYPYPPYRW
jgi:hypothetical protein